MAHHGPLLGSDTSYQKEGAKTAVIACKIAVLYPFIDFTIGFGRNFVDAEHFRAARDCC